MKSQSLDLLKANSTCKNRVTGEKSGLVKTVQPYWRQQPWKECMLVMSLECLDLPSKQQTGHFSSYHSLCMCKCARMCMYVCVHVCAQSTDQVITISLHMHVCVCL